MRSFLVMDNCLWWTANHCNNRSFSILLKEALATNGSRLCDVAEKTHLKL